MAFCIVSQQIAKHAQATGDAEERDEAIEARVAELMSPGGTHDPFDAENIAEAISEAPKSFYVKLSVLLVAGDGIAAAMTVGDVTTEYWHKLATDEAESQLEAERKQAMEDRAADRGQDRKWTDNLVECK